MSDWEWEDFNVPDIIDDKSDDNKKSLTYQQKICYHDWKKTVLVISTVEDCIKCGLKKEDL